MNDQYSLGGSYLHRGERDRAVPRQLPPPPSPDSLLNKPLHQSSNGKKQGSAKGKGAVRAKSGCYTCRIRRKKCDEQPDPTGSCQTCTRLRLECLGFGAKRPDWMRENNSVPELREKIKQFLASQGMIKGHSGSGTRNGSDSIQGPILMLSDGGTSPTSPGGGRMPTSNASSPSSPRSPPTTSASVPHHSGYPHVVTSAIRDHPVHRNSDNSSSAYSPLSPQAEYSSPASYTPLPSISSQSSLHTHNLLHPDNHVPSYLPQGYSPPGQHSSSHNESNNAGSGGSPNSHLHHHPMSLMTPIHTSSYFSPTSHERQLPPILTSYQSHTSNNSQQSAREDDEETIFSPESQKSRLSIGGHDSPPPPSAASSQVMQLPEKLQPLASTFNAVYSSRDSQSYGEPDVAVNKGPDIRYSLLKVPISSDPTENSYLEHYLSEVLKRQYLLADNTISKFLFNFARTSDTAKYSMCLLASLHLHCMEQLNVVKKTTYLPHVNMFYGRVEEALSIGRTRAHRYTEAEAMAGLHLVSSFLFSGGRGPWPIFLEIAMKWVEYKLNNSSNAINVLLDATESERFIIRTTFWFDVWASITRMARPRFLQAYRELYNDDTHAYIGTKQESIEEDERLSVLDIIGCSNRSFRAMAEIATLAEWKETQTQNRSLSIAQLVMRGQKIEETWLPPSMDRHQGNGGAASDLTLRRHVVSEVFRASAKVYLHMVISNSYPESPEIKNAVAETISFLKRVPDDQLNNTRAIVRSVISAICICGCLTEDYDQMQFFLAKLDSLGPEANVFGNCLAVKSLIEDVWNRREKTGKPVDWRELMLSGKSDILLLV